MSTSRYSLHQMAISAFNVRGIQRAAFRVAAARGRAMALVYHRVTPQGAGPHDIPPNITLARFCADLDALGDIGDIVPLADLLTEPASRRRMRIAITFDDDEQCHVDYALPALLARGVTAAFFLNGRVLNDAGPYWWTALEQLIAQRGVAGAAHSLGMAATTTAALAAACEEAPPVELLAALIPAPSVPLLDATGVRSLAEAGMEIGFHTVHHRVLPTLAGAALDDEIRLGRERLADAAGKPVTLFSYPYGRTSKRVAERVRAAGYRAAFRMGGRAIALDSDPFTLGRIGPDPRSTAELMSLLAFNVSRTPDAFDRRGDT